MTKLRNIPFHQVRYPGERVMTNLIHFVGALGWVTILGGFVVIGETMSWWWAAAYLVGFLGAFLIWPILFFNAQIQGNGVLVSEQQFPEIHHMVEEFMELFELRHKRYPEVFVIQQRGFNAFAISALSHNRVVLLSDLVENLMDKQDWQQLKAVVGHELGHHMARHPDWWLLDFPVSIFPFSLLGLYQSRLAELTSDRCGYFLAGDLEATLGAYKKLIAGPLLAARFNEQAYQDQIAANRKSWLLKVANLLNTHPYFTVRVAKLQEYHHKLKEANVVS